jgi:hypothetical protein
MLPWQKRRKAKNQLRLQFAVLLFGWDELNKQITAKYVDQWSGAIEDVVNGKNAFEAALVSVYSEIRDAMELAQDVKLAAIANTIVARDFDNRSPILDLITSVRYHALMNELHGNVTEQIFATFVRDTAKLFADDVKWQERITDYFAANVERVRQEIEGVWKEEGADQAAKYLTRMLSSKGYNSMDISKLCGG